MHSHHRHKRATTASVTLNVRDTTSAMPSLAATSYTYAIEVPTADKSNDYAQNPYIATTSLPQNLVFIIMGGIIGLLLICFALYHFITYMISNRKAKNEKEVYYNFSDSNSLFHDNASGYGDLKSSNSSLWEKSTVVTGGVGNGSNASIYMMSKHNSLINFSQRSLLDTTTISGDSSQPGKSYRNAVNNIESFTDSPIISGTLNKVGHRGSMFISPVLEIVNNGHRKSFAPPFEKRFNGSELSYLGSIPTSTPMMSSFDTDFNEHSLVGSGFDSPMVSTPISDFHPSTDHLLEEATNSKKSETPTRPPSQYLEDLINDIQDYV